LLRRIDGRGVDAKLGVVHRLDKDTSGLIVFARTRSAKRMLAAQFRAHTVDRVYHAIAHGAVAATRVEYASCPRSRRRNARLLRTLSTSDERNSDRGETCRHPHQTDCIPRGCHARRMLTLRPGANIRFESIYPNSAIRWWANRYTYATIGPQVGSDAPNASRPYARLCSSRKLQTHLLRARTAR
jgi:hypothetical protein